MLLKDLLSETYYLANTIGFIFSTSLLFALHIVMLPHKYLMIMNYKPAETAELRVVLS